MVTLGDAPGAEVVHFRMASALNQVTTTVTDDESCYMLAELNLPSANGKGLNRYQILRIVRDDHLETAYVNMGRASRFEADQLIVPGGQMVEGKGTAWHSVAELQEIADHMRSLPPSREIEPSDMQEAWQNMVEEKKRRRKRQSSFGAQGVLVRS